MTLISCVRRNNLSVCILISRGMIWWLHHFIVCHTEETDIPDLEMKKWMLLSGVDSWSSPTQTLAMHVHVGTDTTDPQALLHTWRQDHRLWVASNHHVFYSKVSSDSISTLLWASNISAPDVGHEINVAEDMSRLSCGEKDYQSDNYPLSVLAVILAFSRTYTRLYKGWTS